MSLSECCSQRTRVVEVALKGFRRFRDVSIGFGSVSVIAGCCSGRTSILEAILLLNRFGEVVPGVTLLRLLKAIRGRSFEFSSLVNSDAGNSALVAYALSDLGGYMVKIDMDDGGVVVRDSFIAGVASTREALARMAYSSMRIIHVFHEGGGDVEHQGQPRYARVLYSSPSTASLYSSYVSSKWGLLTRKRITQLIAKKIARLTGERIVDFVLEPLTAKDATLKAYIEGRRIRLEDLGFNAYWLSLTLFTVKLIEPDILLLDDVDSLAASEKDLMADILVEAARKGIQVMVTVSSPSLASELAGEVARKGAESRLINLLTLDSRE